MNAWIFPGQGSQSVGMGAGLTSTAAMEVFRRASEALGWGVRELCLDGPEEALAATERTQPAVVVVSLAAAATLRSLGAAPDLVAGHSVGEVAAIAVAGGLEVDDAVRLVAARGEAMARAGGARAGGMLAVIGLAPEEVERACARAGGTVVVANLNGGAQVVISGVEPALSKAGEIARAAGAKRVVRLEVSGAFHSPLMEPARRALEEAARGLQWRAPAIPVVSGVDARSHADGGELRELIVTGVTSPVRWEDAVRRLAALGATTFVEVGAGRVLSGLVRRILPDARVLQCGDDDQAKQVAEELAGESR